MAFMMNIVTMIVYWSTLHTRSLLDTVGLPLKEFQLYYTHTVPMFVIFANFMLTDVVFRGAHFKVMPPVMVIYCAINYYETKRQGKPIYWFWTWDDY